jgi:hypothetical protein
VVLVIRAWICFISTDKCSGSGNERDNALLGTCLRVRMTASLSLTRHCRVYQTRAFACAALTARGFVLGRPSPTRSQTFMYSKASKIHKTVSHFLINHCSVERCYNVRVVPWRRLSSGLITDSTKIDRANGSAFFTPVFFMSQEKNSSLRTQKNASKL